MNSSKKFLAVVALVLSVMLIATTAMAANLPGKSQWDKKTRETNWRDRYGVGVEMTDKDNNYPVSSYLPNGKYAGGNWFIGDWHSHSTLSDGINTPEEMAAQAKKVGLDFLILSDHNRDNDEVYSAMNGGAWKIGKARVDKLAKKIKFNIKLDEEVSIIDKDRLWLGDFVLLDIDQYVEGMDFKTQECLDNAKKLNPRAIMSPAHTFTDLYECFWFDWDITGYSHIEIWNGHVYPHRPLPKNGTYFGNSGSMYDTYSPMGNIKATNHWDYLNKRPGWKVYATAGGDMHCAKYIGYVFNVCFLGNNKFSWDGIYNAMRKGHTYVSNGPKITKFDINGAMMGDTIKAGKVTIKVGAEFNQDIEKVQLLKNGKVIKEFFGGYPATRPGEPLKLMTVNGIFTDKAVKGDFYRVVVLTGNAQGHVALSNPIFVEATRANQGVK